LRSVQFEGSSIDYDLIIKNVKNINLRIKPDGSIAVSASTKVPIEKVDEFVISKGKYILNALNRFRELEQFNKKPKQYISGEGYKLLGRDLRLKVIQGDKENIKTDGIYIFLTVKDKNDYRRKDILISKWFNEQCHEIFNEIVAEVYSKFQKYGVQRPKIQIRDMKTRWGSCQPKRGIISLNIKLIEAPRNCIEYVVLHELCHYIHPNHSKKFYAFVQMMMPDWKERKKFLEEYLLSL
jgi:predicted metal-dependent hydrolase